LWAKNTSRRSAPPCSWSASPDGHAIAKATEQGTNDVLMIQQGSLYPALRRLMKRG